MKTTILSIIFNTILLMLNLYGNAEIVFIIVNSFCIGASTAILIVRIHNI